MAKKTITAAKGLRTYGNVYTRPEGSATIADNVVIDQGDVWEKRRSFGNSGTYAVSTALDLPNKLFSYRDGLVIHHGAASITANTNAGARVLSTGCAPPSATARVQAAQSNQNLYFTTSTGIQKLENISGSGATVGAAGGKVALDISTLYATDTSGMGWLPADCQVAYRYCVGRKDTNNNLLLGPMSGRKILTNPPGTFTIVAGQIAVNLAATYATVTTPTAHNFNPNDTVSVVLGGAGDNGLKLIAQAGGSGGFITFAAPGTCVVLSTPTSTTFTIQSIGAVPGLTSGSTTTLSTASRNVDVTIDLASALGADEFVQLYRSQPSAGVLTPPDDELNLIYEGTAFNAGTPATYKDIVSETGRRGALPAYTNATQANGGIINNHLPPPFAKDIALFNGVMVYANTVSKQRMFLSLLGTGSTSLNVGNTVTIGGRTYTAIIDTTSIPGANQFRVYTSVYASTITKNIENTARDLIRAINADASSTLYGFYASTETDAPGKLLLESRLLGASAFACTASSTTAGNAFVPSLPTTGTTVLSSDDAAPNRLYFALPGQPDCVPIANYIDIDARTAILRIAVLRDSLFVFKVDGIWRLTGKSNYTVDVFDNTAWLVVPESLAALGNQLMCLTNQGVVAVSETGVRILSNDIEDVLDEAVVTGLTTEMFGVGYESDRRYLLFLPTDNTRANPNVCYCFNTITETWTRWKPDVTTDFARCGIVNAFDDKLYLGQTLTALTALAVESKLYTIADYVGDTAFMASGLKGVVANVQLTPFTGGDVTDGKNFQEVIFEFNELIEGTLDAGFTSDLSTTEVIIAETISGGRYTWRVAVPPDMRRAGWLQIRVQHASTSINFALAGIAIKFEPVSPEARR